MVVIDVETKNFYTDTDANGLLTGSDLQVSFVGAYDTEKDIFLSFWEKDIVKLEEILKGADRVVGYNVWGFDYGVLSPYLSLDPWKLPTLDLMVALKKTIGFRPKLDDLARANLGTGKIGRGVDAVEYWKRGELDKLEKYCLEDVRLTFEVWRAGEEQSALRYYDKDGFLKETPVNWQDGYVQEPDESVQGRLL